MKKELFDELLESVRQGGAILRGEKKPARIYEFSELDVRRIREQYGGSQDKFASLMGIQRGNTAQLGTRTAEAGKVLLGFSSA